MEDLKIELEKWKDHPEFSELCAAYLSVEELKKSFCETRCVAGPPELDAKIVDVEKLFEAKKEICTNTSRFTYWLLLGMSYKFSQSFIHKSADALGRAVKVKWESHDLWNMVGELYWLIGDEELGKACFERGLNMAKNPRSLRNLSMAARKMYPTTSENVEAAVRFAREAIKLDMNDAQSWTALGNAQLSACLHFNRDKKFALESLKAYKIAEKREDPSKLELYFNMAVILKCLEKYDDALDKIDACLKIDSTLEDAICFRRALINFVLGIKEALLMGKPSAVDFKNLSKAPNVVEWGKPSDQKFKRSSFNITPFKGLKEGLNSDVNIFGHIIWAFFIDDTYPYLIGLIDQDGNMTTVHFINMHPGKLFNVRDGLVIRDPVFENVSFQFLGETIQYPAVKVTDASQLALNGKPLFSSFLKPLETTSTVLSIRSNSL